MPSIERIVPSIEALAKQLGSGDQVKAYQARQELCLQVAEAGAADQQQQRGQLAADLVKAATAAEKTKDDRGREVSKATHAAEVRRELLRQASTIAGDAEVPALREALDDKLVRETARYALDRIATQAATDALAEALGKASGVEFQVGVIGALARCGGSGVVEALKQATKAANLEVRLAACEALAQQPEAALDEVIQSVKVFDPAGSAFRAKSRVARSRLQLAATLAGEGQKDAARKILEQLAAGDQPNSPEQQAAEAALERV